MSSTPQARAGVLARLPLAAQLAVLLAGQVALWTVLTAVSHRAPPWDNIEELVWSTSPQWGYYKHPPLPAWLLYGFTALFGHSIWVTYFAAQLCVAAGLALVWRLGCEMTTPTRALLATVLVSLVAYYNVRGVYYNHNVVQIPLVAACILAFYRACRDGRWRDWVLLGLAAGLCMLTKYSAALLFAGLLGYLLWRGRILDRRVASGALASLLVASLVVAPHVAWLAAHDFKPFHYAVESVHLRGVPTMSALPALSDSRPKTLGHFLGTQAARLSVFLIAACAFALLSRRAAAPGTSTEAARSIEAATATTSTATSTGASTATSTATADAPWKHRGAPFDDWEFLLFAGLGPLAITVALGALGGIYLASSWVTMYFLPFGLLALRWIRPGRDGELLRWAVTVAVVLQVLAAGAVAFAAAVLVDSKGLPARSNYPGAELAKRADAAWREHADGPFALLAADTWLGGNVIQNLRPAPRLLIDGSFEKTPWIDPELLSACGALVLVDRSPRANMISTDYASLQAALDRASERGRLELPWGGGANAARVVVDWGVVPAHDPQRCATLAAR